MIQIPSYADAYVWGGNQDGTYGLGPSMFWGSAAIDGDAGPWANVGVGSLYLWRSTTGNNSAVYQKVNDNGDDADWVTSGGVIQETVAYADFTDNTDATGTFTSSESIPIYSTVLYSFVRNVTAFSGNTSCTITIGDGATADRYNTGTPSIFTTTPYLAVGAVSGTAYHAAAKSPVIVATANSDWGLVATTGKLTYTIVYRLP